MSGVSKSTVSNVVRESGTVSAPTRARVLDAVAKLGYRPNATARNLLLRRTNLIGVVVGDVANAFDAELVKGIERYAAASGFTTLVCNTGGDARLEASRIEALLEQRVDGIVLLDFTGDRAVLSQLSDRAGSRGDGELLVGRTPIAWPSTTWSASTWRSGTWPASVTSGSRMWSTR